MPDACSKFRGWPTLRWGRPEAEGDLARLRPMPWLSEVSEPELCLPSDRAAMVLGGSAACGAGRSPELRRLAGPASPEASRIARTRFTPHALHSVLGPAHSRQQLSTAAQPATDITTSPAARHVTHTDLEADHSC